MDENWGLLAADSVAPLVAEGEEDDKVGLKTSREPRESRGRDGSMEGL